MNSLTSDQIKATLEAAIFISIEPVSLARLSLLFDAQERPSESALHEILQVLEAEYSTRSIILQQVASGYRFQVASHLTSRLGEWMAEPPARHSRALLETLALIAYKQPITRSEIEEIRGVAVSTHIIRTLEERDWIKPIGQRDVPGKPTLYGTTVTFLNDLNLQNLSQLPPLLQTHEEEAAIQLSLELEPAIV